MVRVRTPGSLVLFTPSPLCKFGIDRLLVLLRPRLLSMPAGPMRSGRAPALWVPNLRDTAYLDAPGLLE
jgi:hypothetical protein